MTKATPQWRVMSNQDAIRAFLMFGNHEHFWSKVSASDNGCALWGGWRDRQGYGHYYIHGRKLFAHRVAFSIATGVILDSVTVVMHMCDTPACVNPGCLRSGTPADNMSDKVAKGRQAVGDRLRGRLLYSDATVARAIAMLADGVPFQEVALASGISDSHLRSVAKGSRRSYIRERILAKAAP